MEKKLIKQIIISNQELIKEKQLINRAISLEKNANYVIIGPRRAGKTYLLHQIIKNRYKENLERVLYLNFEDERLFELNYKSLNLIIESYSELFDHKPHLFFDEIQNIKHWEKFVRRLADEEYTIFITGSNSTMLSNQIASTLGGRFMIKELLPLSFNEFLTFNDVKLDKHYQLGAKATIIKRLFNSYFTFGGFPELIKFDDKRNYLSNVFRKLLFGDIIARYTVKNDKAIQLVVKKMAESVNNETSVNRIKNLIKSIGIPIGTTTIFEYLHYLDESFLIFPIKNYVNKFVERETTKKYYFVDNGILMLFLNDQDTKLLENLIYLSLRRKYNDIYYYKRNIEVDFYIPEADLLIQVSYNISDPETEKREVKALIKAKNELSCKNAMIISFNNDKQITYKNTTINVIPAWQWLLEN